MRIGLFTDQFSAGISGQTTSVKMLYNYFKQNGHDCYIFTSHSKKLADNDPDIINLPGIPYPMKNLRKYRFSPYRKQHINEIEAYKLDIIHVHTEYYLAKIALAAKAELGIPVVYTLHTMWEYYLDYLSKPINKVAHEQLWRIVSRAVFPKLARGADMIVVPSKKVYDRRRRYLMGDNMVVIPTGIDLERFNSATESKRTDDKIVFLYLGRLSPEKSIDVSLRAFADMKNRDNAKMVIVGDGPSMHDLKQLAEELSITEQTVFTGKVPRNETVAYYKSADAFVSASKTESQGLTFLEALASHLPIYAIRDEVIEELVEDGKNGYLCDSAAELTQRMEQLCETKEPPSEFKPLDGYSVQDYARKILELYKKVIHESKHKKPPRPKRQTRRRNKQFNGAS